LKLLTCSWVTRHLSIREVIYDDYDLPSRYIDRICAAEKSSEVEEPIKIKSGNQIKNQNQIFSGKLFEQMFQNIKKAYFIRKIQKNPPFFGKIYPVTRQPPINFFQTAWQIIQILIRYNIHSSHICTNTTKITLNCKIPNRLMKNINIPTIPHQVCVWCETSKEFGGRPWPRWTPERATSLLSTFLHSVL